LKKKKIEIEQNKRAEWDLYVFVLEFGFASMLKHCIANNQFI